MRQVRFGNEIGVKHCFRRRKADAQAIALANAEFLAEPFLKRAVFDGSGLRNKIKNEVIKMKYLSFALLATLVCLADVGLASLPLMPAGLLGPVSILSQPTR